MTRCWGEPKPHYVAVWWQGKVRSRHVMVYEAMVGPIPEGMEVDHTCHQKWCYNPDHLEAVTHSENLRRRRPFKRIPVQVCKHGHDLSDAYVTSEGKRQCRTCRNDRQRRYRLAAV